MKVPALAFLVLALGGASLQAQNSTINATNKYAYAANLGWVDMRSQLPSGDPLAVNGVVVGEFVCSGYAYSANVGWINFGAGNSPNGYYSNLTQNDFGVNQDGTGRLRGFAYGANIGWINFEDTGNPSVNLQPGPLQGQLSGYAYSANCGWINLGQFTQAVVTDIVRRGLSTTGDGIPDAWKIIHFGSVGAPLAAANADPDGDGKSNLQEYLDGTDPNNANSALRITAVSRTVGMTTGNVPVTWTSIPLSSGYRYTIEKNSDLLPATLWVDSGLGMIMPSLGTTSTAAPAILVSDPQYFYRVRAFQTPLLKP